MTNYRPIITLPVLAFFFEKLAHKRMMCFINRLSLLNTNQIGFLAGQNTSDALTEFLDKAYDAESYKQFSWISLKLLIQLIKKFFRKNCITMTSDVEVWTGFVLF